MKERNKFFIQIGNCIKSLTLNKCTDDGLPYYCYYRPFHDEDYLLCPKCREIPDHLNLLDYYYCNSDYKYGFPRKLEQIYEYIKIAEESIKINFYPLYKKYSTQLEGNRKRRFEKNYNSMFKKMDILKKYINELIKGYHNNKLGIIYLLYHFPPIVINKFTLNIKDIDEDVYISKLSLISLHING